MVHPNKSTDKKWLVVGLLVLALATSGFGSASARSIRAGKVQAVAVPQGPKAAADSTIYDDALVNGWQDWSWQTTRDFTNAQPVHSGLASIAVTYTVGWGGLYLHNATALPVGDYTAIHFWVHGGGTGGQSVRFHINDGGGGYSFPVQSNTWLPVTVPLAALGSPTTLSDLYWQDGSGHSQPTFYLDDISLISKASAASPNVDWMQVNENGFGNPANGNVMSLEVFGGQLYAGTYNWNEGGQVWRTADGRTWTAMSEPGFGSAYTTINRGLLDMIEFNGELYVCTGWGWDTVTSGQIWRSPDGTLGSWTQVEGAGFGDTGNSAIATFAVFNDQLYAATQSSNGLEVWRSSTGNSEDWARVVDNGKGNANNNIITSLMDFNGYLYAAVENDTDGAEIWRTDNGSDWMTVRSGGFGSAGNSQTGGFAILAGDLYIGTHNDITGGQIWRSDNGIDWTQVVGNGFGDINNFKIESLLAYHGVLYAGTDNNVTGVEMWRSTDGNTWTQQINVNGFGDSHNTGTLWSVGSAIFKDNLYIATANDFDGGEVWAKITSPLSAGQWHTCELTDAGGAECWGANGYGQLGDGTTANRSTPVDVNGLTNWVSAISAGGWHTCALTTDGGVKCWGANGSGGQLGDGTTTDRHSPVDVSGLTSGVVAVSAGGAHTCALTTGGKVECWGHNNYGQLGDGTTTDSSIPVDVSGLASGVVAISAGFTHTCALTADGGVKCWGFNGYGELGDGTTENKLTPVDVSGLASGISAISAGMGHACGLTASGGVKCWGSNGDGELGDGTTENKLTPVDVSGLASGASIISTEMYHTCVLTSIGGGKCWGLNKNYQLGDGTTNNSNIPVDVSGLTSGAITISAGGYHSCALRSDGNVGCWGNGEYGQLRNGMSDGPYNGRLVLDGTDKYASAPYQSELDLRGKSFTVEMWLKLSDAVLSSGDFSIVPFYQYKGFYFHLDADPHQDLTQIPPRFWSTYCIAFSVDSSVSCLTSLTPFRNGWVHLAGVYDNSGGTRVYWNGQLLISWPITQGADPPGDLFINHSFFSGNNNFLGSIDEVRISDIARYSDSFVRPTAPFVCDANTKALWHFDEPEGSTVFHDSCGIQDNYITAFNGAHIEGVLPCYTLTMAYTGSGSDPIATPANSSGCTSGQYRGGELISMTASPASGWAVGSWSGTGNDASTSTTNNFNMPSTGQTITANYIQNYYQIFLPLVVR